jgi:hypothetical protein
MRRYEEGARLLTHVDRTSTHAASLIINVAQGMLREPWKVRTSRLKLKCACFKLGMPKQS